MHITQLRQADLNLLVVFTALAEERNVSRAARRLSLSQPALTRALQRLRQMFNDDLFVRVSGNYEPTPKGQQLLRELEDMLPRLDRLLTGAAFDPAREEVRFRLAGTDYAAHVIGLALCRQFLVAGNRVSFDLAPVTDLAFDALERGQIDLLLYADDGRISPAYPRETIFEDRFVCVVAHKNPLRGPLSIRQYLNASHIGVSTFDGQQTLPERTLAAVGLKRDCVFRLPYFSMAIRAVADTSLIATVPKRLAAYESHNPALKILKAPEMLGAFKYLMTWHPRMNSDAAHQWLRSMVQQVGKNVTL